MKYLLPIAILVTLLACKKETQNIPHLTFTPEDKKWFVFKAGQQLIFKNDQGDSLVYRVTLIEKNNFTPEYADTSRNIVAYSEAYNVQLRSATDSINIYFYKELKPDPNKLRNTILWTTMRGQVIYLAAIEHNASFNQKTVNGLTYTTVTTVVPSSDAVDPFTRFDKAYYDQGAGFIEIIDMNGVSWKRV
jgi:hypothetical protein